MPLLPMVNALDDWRPIFTDPTVWRRAIEQIWRRHRLGDVRTIGRTFPGSNAVFVVNDAWVVKIFAPFWEADAEREIELLRVLSSVPGIPAPRLIADGWLEDIRPWRYLIMTHCPGARLGDVWDQVPPSDRESILHHLADMLRGLHAVPVARFSTMDGRPEAWRQFVEKRIERAETHHRSRSMPEPLLRELPGYLAEAAPLLCDRVQPTVIHADLTRDHLLLASQDGRWRIVGLIDFGDAMVGRRDYEWVALHLDLLDADRCWLRSFLRAYDPDLLVDTDFPRRMMALSLLHLFSDLTPLIERLGGPQRVRTLADLERALWRV
ncbi:MAG: hypothetical protein Kow0047_09650 [Anaerolineae bacterium]